MTRQTALLLRFDAMKEIMVEVENLLIKNDRDGALAAIRSYKTTYGELDAQLYDANIKERFQKRKLHMEAMNREKYRRYIR